MIKITHAIIGVILSGLIIVMFTNHTIDELHAENQKLKQQIEESTTRVSYWDYSPETQTYTYREF